MDMNIRRKGKHRFLLTTSRLIGMLAAVVFLSSCATPEIRSRIAAFSEGTTTVATNTATAFEMVDRNYYQTQVARLVADYDTKGFKPDTIQRFLPADELQVRLDALETLSTYAQSLADIMGDAKLTEFDSQTKAFGEKLLKLKDNPALKKFAPGAGEMNAFTTAVDTLGRWFIEYKRQKGVKQIVQEMDEPVRTICQLLIADIGQPPGKEGTGARGLRSQLWNQYSSLLMYQDSFILKNKETLDPRSRREEIEKLPVLVSERETADATLAATQTALTRLAETHAELARAFDAPTPKLDSLVRRLADEGKRINQYYRSIGK